MPEQVIAAIMQRRNPRTGQNYTRVEAESLYAAKRASLRKHNPRTQQWLKAHGHYTNIHD